MPDIDIDHDDLTDDTRALTHNSTVAKSEPDWGTVDKTKLPRQAFADQGQPGKKSTWSYPHHWVEGGTVGADGVYTGGTMYLHKGGLNAAWAAAQGAHTGQKASPAIITHLQRHRTALGLTRNLPEGTNMDVITQKELFCRFVSDASLEIRQTDQGRKTLSFAASSEMPVDRWYGTEVLSHDPGAVNLDRARMGAMPLLFNHNINDPIGMITGARLEKGRMMVDANLFDTPRAAEVEQMMAGGLRNVSLAYRVNVLEENTSSNTFTATDWQPFEVSIVTVPADPSVGIGRFTDEYEIRMITRANTVPSREESVQQPTSLTRSTTMPTQEVDQKQVEDEEKRKANNISAVEAEKQRVEAIRNLCKAQHIDHRIEDRWVYDGVPLTTVAKEVLEVMEERGKQKPAVASELGLTTGETRKYSLFRAIRAMQYGGKQPALITEAGFELECSRALAKKLGREVSANILVPAEVLTRPLDKEALRAMATTPASKGGYLVSTDNMGFIDILRNRSVAMAMGARVLSGLQGNVTFPRQTGKPSVTWQAGEGSSVTAADQTLGQIAMTPRTCIAITDVSEQLLRQSSPSAESFIMADLAADIAVDGVDNAVINGTGGAQPIGIKNTTGITSGQDAASATYAKILAFVSTAGGANAIRGNPGWVTNTAGAAKLMQVQRFTSTDTPVWTGNMLDGNLVGFRAMSSEQLASANLIFGSWDEVVIGEWGVLELATDNGGTRFNQAQVGIRAMWMVDVMIRYPQAFVVSVNLS